MKLVIAIIKPFKLDEVREALTSIGVAGMTVTEVKGIRPAKGPDRDLSGGGIQHQHGAEDQGRGGVRLDLAGRVVETMQAAANTGAIGDGKIFVLDVGQAVRIRTGETDDAAL